MIELHPVEKPETPGSGKPIKDYRLTKKGYKALAQLKRQNELMWRGIKGSELSGKTES